LLAGNVIASGTVSEVVGQTQRNAYRVQVPSSFISEAPKILEMVPSIMRVSVTDETAGWLRLEITNAANESSVTDPYITNRVLEALIHAEIPILGFEAEGGRLQDVFLQLTQEEIK
jgi:hypothetical protein